MKRKEKKVKAEVVDITIHASAFNLLDYCIVIGRDELGLLCSKMDIDMLIIGYPIGTAMRTLIEREVDGRKLCIIRLQECHRYDPTVGIDADVIGIITHEITHVKQDFMDYIDESNPSSEFEAYVMQDMVSNIMRDYLARAK